MRANDLGKLVVTTTRVGQLDLEKLRAVFALFDPDEVTAFVDEFVTSAEAVVGLSYAQIFDALLALGFDSPDMLTCPVIAAEIRKQTQNKTFPTKLDVAKVLTGMQILTPQLLRIQGDNVFLGARPDKFREAIIAQVAALPQQFIASGGNS